MRDINRIRPFCERLIKAWEKAPDLRFGQLVLDAFDQSGHPMFYEEDDAAIECIESFVKNTEHYPVR